MPIVDLSAGDSDVAENLGVSKAQVNLMLVEGNGIDKAYDGTAGTVTLSVEGLPDSATVLSDADLDVTVASQNGLNAHAVDTTSIHGIANTAALLTTVAVPTNITATGTASGTTFLRGDGAWAVPAGGGGGSGDLIAANNLSDVASTATARTNLGLAIGTNVQAYSATLAATTASFLTADETKLDGIDDGAEVNTIDSVNGQTGAVVLDAGDVNAEEVGVAAAAISAHSADTTAVHGIANTAALLTTVVVPGSITATGTPSSSTFLRGDGTWATAGGGGGGDLLAANNLADLDDVAEALDNLGISTGLTGLPITAAAVVDYTATSSAVINAGTSTTGWGSVNHQTAFAYDAGQSAVKVVLKAGVANASFTSKAYYNLSSPLNVTTRAVVEMDMRFDLNINDLDFASRLEFVVADGVALAGNVSMTTWSGDNENTWLHIVIPVGNLTTISSIGMRTISARGTVPDGDTTAFWFRNVTVGALSEVQNAQEVGKTPLVFEGDTVSAGGTWAARTDRPRADFRFTHAVHPGLRGVRDLREWDLDEDGTTDMTSDIARVINSLDPGTTLVFPAGAHFLTHSTIKIYRKHDITVDFNGAIMFDTAYRLPPVNSGLEHLAVASCSDVRLLNGTIFGYKSGDTDSSMNVGTGSATFITTIAGSPTTSGSTKLLDAQNEGIRVTPYAGARTSWLGRHYDLTLGPVNKMSVILSDSAHVASDCRIRMTDTAGYILAESTLTLTATPTEYALTGAPRDLSKVVRLEIVKMTATSNTITISTVKLWGKSSYVGAAEFTSGLSMSENNYRIETTDWWIENVGGYGWNYTGRVDAPGADITARRVITRAASTQGFAAALGTRVALYDCKALEAGRTGLDFEPYASDWLVDGVIVRDFEARNPVNYAIACGPWAKIVGLDIDGVTVDNAGVGAFVGGARGAKIDNIHVKSGSGICIFTGQNMKVGPGALTHPFKVGGGTQDGAVGITYTPGGNSFSGWKSALDTLEGVYAFDFGDGTSTIGPGGAISVTGAATAAGNTQGTGAAKVAGRPAMVAFDVGVHRQRMGNTYRGVAYDQSWHPYGSQQLEGLVSTLGVSGTATPAVNMRGIAVAVTQTATSKAIAFPSKGYAGQHVITTGLSDTTPTGTFTPGQVYYYSFCTRPHWRHGHKTANTTTKTVTISAGHNAVNLGVSTWQDLTNGYNLAGVTIYRGTTAVGGPWNTRFDVIPLSPWYSIRGDTKSFYDIGGSLLWKGLSTTTEWGYPNMTATLNVAATAQSGTWTTLVDETGYEPDAAYGVIVTPSWATTVNVTAKATSGFTINFGTAAPASATVDWFLVR